MNFLTIWQVVEATGYSRPQIYNMLQGDLLTGSKREIVNGKATWLIPDHHVDMLKDRRATWKASRYSEQP